MIKKQTFYKIWESLQYRTMKKVLIIFWKERHTPIILYTKEIFDNSFNGYVIDWINLQGEENTKWSLDIYAFCDHNVFIMTFPLRWEYYVSRTHSLHSS